MAMNKKEKAAFEAAVRNAMKLGALRWTSPVTPDVPIPGGFGGEKVTGWSFNAHSQRVYPSYSTAVSHGEGSGTDRHRVGTQGAIRQYSTRALALKAMRHEIERACAENLVRVDLQLKEEDACSTSTKGEGQ